MSDLTKPVILYVDDELGNRVVFEHNLRSEFAIKTASDGAAALRILDSEQIAVLVTDVRMPGIDGLELLRIAKERVPNTIRMVITAFSDIDPILRAINEGLVARYIVKPFDRNELIQVLRWATELWSIGQNSQAVLGRMLETERLASLGGLTALYVHDIRTPVMMVNVTLDELQAVADATPAVHDAIAKADIDPRIKAHLLERIDTTPELVDDATKAARVVDGMLQMLWEFVRPQSQRGLPPVIDPMPIIEFALSMTQRVMTHASGRIQYRGPKELPRIRMSPVDLTQVMLNLIGNASQAVAARGEPNRQVEVEARPRGDMLELLIRDEGVGIPPAVLQRIGTPFFTTRPGGTGLGIANCQRLVGTAGGRMQIESEVGVGTIVTVVLPTMPTGASEA